MNKDNHTHDNDIHKPSNNLAGKIEVSLIGRI